MDRNSNTYTFIYASVMVVVVATVLAVAATWLKPFQAKNVEIEKKQNILQSVNIETTAENAEATYESKIVDSYIVNVKGEKVDGDAFKVDLKKERAKRKDADKALPIYVAKIDGATKYIVPLYGTGLWGPIWGYIALNDDLNTIFGATFDHQGETPGLGAEIASDKFQKPFIGKTIFEGANLTSIIVAKAGEIAPEQHKVDGVSGGTITSKGLEKMLLDDLSLYQEFFKKQK